MAGKNAFRRYTILNKCFQDFSREYTIEDLANECSDKMGGQEISTDQINKDINVFRKKENAPLKTYKIKGSRKSYYRYSDPNYSVFGLKLSSAQRDQLALSLDFLKNFEGLPMFEATAQLLEEFFPSNSDISFNKVISFDQNQDLKGLVYFNELSQYIIHKKVIDVEYQPHHASSAKTVSIHPYFLKQYNNRWFLIGDNAIENYPQFTILALDRIQSVTVNKKIPYLPTEEALEDYFYNVVGVSVSQEEPTYDVVINVSNKRVPYITSKPIHPNQRNPKKISDELSQITIKSIQLNKELTSQLLQFGGDIEVLEPKELRDELKSHISILAENYDIL